MVSIHHILWYNPISLKKDRTSSTLTFSNKSLKLFTLKNKNSTFYENIFSGVRCLTGETQVKHCGCTSCLSIKERVKPRVTNSQSGYNDLLFSWFSESWSPFSENGLDLEEFVVDVIISVLSVIWKVCSHNPDEASQSICCAKGEGAVIHRAVSRWVKKFQIRQGQIGRKEWIPKPSS